MNLIFFVVTLFIIYSVVADAFLFPIKFKRRANEPTDSHVPDYEFRPAKFPGRNFPLVNKRAVKYPSRRKRNYEDDENYDNDNDYSSEYYPYRNVGSLFVDGDQVVITQPMYNFGVDRYGNPPFAPPYGDYFVPA